MKIGRSYILLAIFTFYIVPSIYAYEPMAMEYGIDSPILDVTDPIGDDKGPGYYTYPLDKRISRGDFDLKRFTVYEEGTMLVFKIQMREYIKTARDGFKRGDGEEQPFVINAFDIYIDIDGKRGSGWNRTLPGRDLLFADGKGWEKMILVTPLSQFKAYDILKEKTDELDFQDMITDIILPDYVQVQRDTIIIKISKKLFDQPPSPYWGFQCLVMGYANVVSPNRLLNMDVKAFATQKDFGGGWDTYGDPPVIDMIVPGPIEEAAELQYSILRAYRSDPYRNNIEHAMVPFVYGKLNSAEKVDDKKIQTPVVESVSPVSTKNKPQPQTPVIQRPPVVLVNSNESADTPKVKTPTATQKSVSTSKQPTTIASASAASGFVPLRQPKAGALTVGSETASGSFKQLKKSDAPLDGGFIPIRKSPTSGGK